MDFPREDERQSRSAAAVIEFLVGPDGQPLQCVTSKTYGDPELAAKFCPIVLGKHFKPATFRDGTPEYSVIHSMLSFYIPETPLGMKISAMQAPIDFELTYAKIPPEGRAFPVRLVFAVNEAGVATDCGADAGENRKAAADFACQALNGTNLGQRTDAAGRPLEFQGA